MVASSSLPADKTRNIALDALRGVAVFFMILVNFPLSWGHLYPFLAHAKGDGLTLADLVFPLFLWTVGYSIYHSLEKNHLLSPSGFFYKVGSRSILLFSAGIFLAYLSENNLDRIRIPGVLQRIAFCYFIVILCFRFLSFRTAIIGSVIGCILLSLINRFVALVDGNILLSLQPPEIGSSIGASMDRAIFGAHLWKETKVYDPEGFYTSIVAILSVVLGVSAAHQIDLKKNKDDTKKQQGIEQAT